MPSPFPGMDPYLEGPPHWSDFHPTLIQALRELIADQLPPNYFAGVNEDVLMVEPDVLSKEVQPDVTVIRQRSSETIAPANQPDVALLESQPVIIPNVIRFDPRIETFIEVRHLPDREVVTVVELLSPSNKTGSGRAQYLAKRDSLLREDIHVVELDLIRGGQRLRLERPLPAGHYYAFISRVEDRPDCGVYHWTVRQRPPRIPIPLRAPDADVLVDLAAAIVIAYGRGRYGQIVNYSGAPPPPVFDPADAEWVMRTAAAAAR